MSDQDDQYLRDDLQEAHTLITIAHRTLANAEGDPNDDSRPSPRIQQVLNHLEAAHQALDALMDEVEHESAEPVPGPRGNRSHLVH
jgi:hypothetical protein